MNRYRVGSSIATLVAGLAAGIALTSGLPGRGAPEARAGSGNACADLPSHAELKAALSAIVTAGGNGGLGFNMWVTAVNRDSEVCAVAFSGADRGAQWPGSRVISAQKANTGNAFSLPGFALSTANLYAPVQPGGSLFGLQESNPVDTGVAYGGTASHFGKANDPMVGKRVGGVNVFGGGLGLYNSAGTLVGALGVSGDTSCTDHVIAWKLRHDVNLDNVPAGVSATGDDNIIHDETMGFGHPVCDAGTAAIAANLPATHPIGPTP